MDAVDKLVGKLRPEDLPVFSATVQEVINITRNDRSSAVELTRAVLSDAGMTAHVLHVANRIPYNPSARAIATVSQAVLLLGFEAISRLSLTAALIDSLLKGNAQQYLINLMSESLHAAVQAHALSLVRKDHAPEDVFVATLLKRIGDIALWSLSPESSERVAELIDRESFTVEQAQREVFGCVGDELTLRLSSSWSLGELLSLSLSSDPSDDPRITCMALGEDIAHLAATGDEEALEAKLPEIRELLQLESDDQVANLIEESSEFASDMARHLGLPTELISKPTGEDTDSDLARSQWLEPDPAVQHQVLAEIAALLDGPPNINLLLEMVSEGIYRGAGMDTVFFALLAQDRRSLAVRYLLTQEEHPVVAGQKMKVEAGGCVAQCICTGETMWYPKSSTGHPDPLLQKQSRGQEFFLQPIIVGKTPVGVFYADRVASERPMDSVSFDAFSKLCERANQGLAKLQHR